MLDRLRIAQRLSLLLMLPVSAVVLISVPFTVDRVDAARSAAAIVDSAADARAVGTVIQELQQERLLALSYLATPDLRRDAIIAQEQSTVYAAGRARASLRGPASAALSKALLDLGDLASLRQSTLARRSSVTEVYNTYHGAVVNLINALRLGDQPGADAVGARQMNALDALLRTNEEANRIGAALVVAAVDPVAASTFASSAGQLREVHLENFRQLGDPAHIAFIAREAEGPSAASSNALLSGLTSGQPKPIAVGQSLSVAQTGIVVGRVVQDSIAREVASGANSRAAGARAAAATVAAFGAALIVLVIWLGMAVSRSVARPLRRVTLAATAVADLAAREMVRAAQADADVEGPPRLAALTLHSADEVGELASAFNRVQATAALLMEQQVTTRRNTAVMFGNIANRTQSLVARQLAQIDHLERHERDEERLSSLYRLDHLTARLRRSADSLLVIAGTRDDARLESPAPLAEIIRAATAEVEGYQSVRLASIDNVTILAAAVPDLTLLLAELLENATSFSPPDVPVEVSASLGSGCLIRIVDHGIGMSPDRLAEENSRLVARERLDVAPTSMLGLFVVGRVARRHNIDVRLVPTPISGVTAEVFLPPDLQLTVARQPPQHGMIPPPMHPAAISGGGPVPVPPSAQPTPPIPPLRPAPKVGTAPAGSEFGWFDPYQNTPRQPVAAVNGSAGGGEQTRGGLRRRQPATGPLDFDPIPSRRYEPSLVRDPQGERAALDAFDEGTERANRTASFDPAYPRTPYGGVLGQPYPHPSGPATAPAGGRQGLHRRRPGEHMEPGLREETGRHHAPSTHAAGAQPTMHHHRDAEAERNQLNGYLDGLARAADSTHLPRDPWSRP
jgi:signal transduction histidine kinase